MNLDNASFAFICLICITILAFIAALNIYWHKEWMKLTPEERQYIKNHERMRGDW